MNFLKKNDANKKIRVGAAQKREKSKRITKGEDIYSAAKFKQEQTGRLLAVLFGFIVALIFSYLFSNAWLMEKHNFQPTGFYDLDKLLVGPGIEAFFGIPMLDAALAYGARAFAVCVLTAVVPYSAYLLSVLMGTYKDTSYFHLNWAVNLLWLLGIQLYLQFVVLYTFFVS